jgi:hypothetical protein
MKTAGGGRPEQSPAAWVHDKYPHHGAEKGFDNDSQQNAPRQKFMCRQLS